MSSIYCKRFISSNWSGRICLYRSLKGVGLVSFMVCLTTEVFPRSRSSKQRETQTQWSNPLLPFVLELTNWQSQWDPPYWIFSSSCQESGTFFWKVKFPPKILSLLLDKLETKSVFFFQKIYSLRQKYLHNSQSYLNPPTTTNFAV